MAPTNKNKQAHREVTQAASDSAYAEGHRKLKDWTTRLYGALNDSEGYGRVHMNFFREFEKLSDQLHGSNKRSILPYVASVFNHTASQGYQPDIHYDALFQGMSAYCQNQPPPTWTPPPDQFDKSPTPTLPLSAPQQSTQLPTPAQPAPVPPPTPIAPAAKSKKADKATSKEKPAPGRSKPVAKGKAPAKPMKQKQSREFVDDSTDGEYRDGDTSDGGNAGETKPLDRELVKCSSCEKDGHPCLINPSTVNKSSPACYECFSSKRKCSLCKKTEGGRKRKPVAVAPGAAGELTRKSLPWKFIRA